MKTKILFLILALSVIFTPLYATKASIIIPVPCPESVSSKLPEIIEKVMPSYPSSWSCETAFNGDSYGVRFYGKILSSKGNTYTWDTAAFIDKKLSYFEYGEILEEYSDLKKLVDIVENSEFLKDKTFNPDFRDGHIYMHAVVYGKDHSGRKSGGFFMDNLGYNSSFSLNDQGKLVAYSEDKVKSPDGTGKFSREIIDLGSNGFVFKSAKLDLDSFTVTDIVPDGKYEFYAFQKDLRMGINDPDVKELQKLLNRYSPPISSSGPGSLGNETEYFGELTRMALIRFQNQHKNQLGITAGTGFFGPATRELINSWVKQVFF